jgi:SEC-C motif/PBS lyase HEAT-like repeat
MVPALEGHMSAHAAAIATQATTPLPRLLAECEGELSEPALAEARRMGADASSAIVAACLEAELTSPTYDCTPIAALQLATELRLAGTVPALASCVLRADVDDDLWDAALTALCAIGTPAVQPLLEVLDAHPDPVARVRLADALVEMQARDERILTARLRLLEEDAVEGARSLEAYGDPRALPALLDALDRAELDPLGDRDFLANEDVLRLAAAVEALGGTLTDEQRAKQQRVLQRRARVLREAERLGADEIGGRIQVPFRKKHRPGRNDACHCGSGKKYKKCHLDADAGRSAS